ncbi:hypothetical protein QQP08_018525 [Theobroma cacao]|nr:hypothetical protein QQP08_018525 [Theobroma cacao]
MALVRVPSSFPSILPSVFPKKLLSVSSSFPISCSSKSTPNQVKNNDDNSNIDNPKGPKRLSEQSSWEAKDSEGRDYLYRLGKEADNMNIAVGARAGVIDDLFAGNFLGRDCIWGGKGQGKSFQTELIFQAMGIEPVIMSAGELESERAGEPGKLIREPYRTASQVVQNQVRSFTTLILDICMSGFMKFNNALLYLWFNACDISLLIVLFNVSKNSLFLHFFLKYIVILLHDNMGSSFQFSLIDGMK